MSNIESALDCLDVCASCPNRIDDQPEGVVLEIGEAEVTLSERTFRAVYFRMNEEGRPELQAVEEQATQTINDDPIVEGIFKKCKNGAAQGLFERFGLKPMTGECPAVARMVGGDPTDADVVAEYIETRTTDF